MKQFCGLIGALTCVAALLPACSQAPLHMQLDVDSVRTLHSPLVLKEAVLESVGAKEKPEPSNDVPKKEIPIIELIRRIVTNDDLEEPRRLFGETMGLKEYGVYQMKWGVRAVSANSKEVGSAYRGVESIEYSKSNLQDQQATSRYLGLLLNSSVSCLDVDQVVSGFGEEFVIAPPHIVAPIAGSFEGETVTPRRSVPGLIYQKIRFADGAKGRIGFYFYHNNCVDYVTMGF